MPEVNVGPVGGDLASRRFALLVTGGLTAVALPLSGASEGALKLAALTVAICGTLFLMAGLVFLQKTHYAWAPSSCSSSPPTFGIAVAASTTCWA